ncbi:T9SS type A sorting domain-containing protein [uncultured Psychroserpens sp.]|uniref:T9SS type A sorting domain-containing protein n=1 Tax=uncultured Psychroserpens sp. TaxID=255436 RepID=UPI0026017DAA|nr:T9SS type A sorting domain-containing protein [uncultured Psychroserpens sp.]
MNLRLSYFCLFALFYVLNTSFFYSQNLLDSSTWTIGSGSVAGFNQSGSTSENIRELGPDHLGHNVVLWKAVPDASGGGSDGGWNTPYLNIDNTKTYRFTVWIKKTNSINGVTFFGAKSYSSGTYHTLTLSGGLQTNPYFFAGDLPILDRWYLLVGFVHHKNYSSSIHQGKLYDGVTGEVVQSLNDFKFKNTATNILHRAYLSYNSNTSNRQFFYDPSIEVADGSETPINELLSINTDSKLIFAFDNSGNQKQRYYCPIPGCTIPTPPAGRQRDPNNTSAKKEVIVEEETSSLQDEMILYPNPTRGIVSIALKSNLDITLSDAVRVYNNSGTLVREIPSKSKTEMKMDLTNLPVGTYLIHVHMSNGEIVTKKIIKN